MGIAKKVPAVEVLKRTISDLEQRVDELKRTANALMEAEGLPPMYPAVRKRPEFDENAFRLGEGSQFSCDTQD